MSTWDIRKEANKFETDFQELQKQEQDLYNMTLDDENNKNNSKGYMEILFTYKNLSLSLLEQQLMWLNTRIHETNLENNSKTKSNVNIPISISTLNLDIDMLSKSLLEAQNERNIISAPPEHYGFLDTLIKSLTKDLFGKLLEFRDVSRSTRLMLIAELQSQLSSNRPKTPPLIFINHEKKNAGRPESPPLNYDSDSNSVTSLTSSVAPSIHTKGSSTNKNNIGAVLNRVKSIATLGRSLSISLNKKPRPASVSGPPSSEEKKRRLAKRSSMLSLGSDTTLYRTLSFTTQPVSKQSISTFFGKQTPTPNASRSSTPANAIPLQDQDSADLILLIQRLTRENGELTEMVDRMKEWQLHQLSNPTATPLNTFSSSGNINRSDASTTEMEVWDEAKSAWEQDEWRIESLNRFQRDLEFLDTVNGTDAGVNAQNHVSEMHKRHRERLEARIFALTAGGTRKRSGLSLRHEATEDDEEENFGLNGFVVEQTVLHHYEASKDQHIGLRVGDRVTVSMTFTDGLAHGINHTSNLSGFFPLAHLETPSADHPDISKTTTRNLIPASNFNFQDGAISKRASMSALPSSTKAPPRGSGNITFSQVPAQQALQIISSLPPDKRVRYFEQLGQSPAMSRAKSGSELSTRSSIAEIPAASNATSNWSVLRETWRERLEIEIGKSLTTGMDGRLEYDRAKRESFWRLIAENYSDFPSEKFERRSV